MKLKKENKKKRMKIERKVKVGELNRVPILIVDITTEFTTLTRPLTRIELQFLCDELNELCDELNENKKEV